MKRVYTIAIGCLLTVLCASAQTNVSGFINANTTWTLAGSPYIVTGNALLSQGFTLTIDPGVVVKFDSNKALQIDGQLIAIGTVSQRIVFTSNQSSPQPGDWAKLHFSDFSTDAVYNAQGNYVSGTIMKYCDVLYAGSLMWGSIDIQQCSPYFNHCRIMDGSWCGINFNGQHLTVDTSRISNFPKRGIYFQGENFLLRNDTLISNLEGAINFLQTGVGAQSRILDSYFRLNYGALCWQSTSPAHITILRSTFVQNNGPYVVSMRGDGDTLSCNRFRNNSNGPAIEFVAQCSTAVVHNNLIDYNVNSNGPSVFNINAGGCDSLFITNNTVTHNSSPGNSCSYFQLSLGNATRVVQIYNNTFTENDGINFLTLWGPQTNNPAVDFVYMNSNTFINPLCTYELNNMIPYGSPNLMVGGNYWGNSSNSFVDVRIYDYFDFANQSIVYYMPILTFPIAVDTACQPFQLPLGMDEEHSFLEGSLYPNPATNQFTVNSSLYSGRGEVLVLRNSLGQEVKRVPITTPDEVISCEELTDGMYFYTIYSEGELISGGKLFKE